MTLLIVVIIGQERKISAVLRLTDAIVFVDLAEF